MNPLAEKYHKEIIPVLKKELGVSNDLAVPGLVKIVLNIGAGEDLANQKEKETVFSELSAVSGQKPISTTARKAISGFKIREGQEIGVKVTLRGKRMYEFFQKLIAVVLPRVRDFRGLPSQSFDKAGSYSLGFREQVVFPEIDTSKMSKYRGLQVTIVTTAKNPKETKRLLELFGMPFRE